jgi:hypothetical protein
MTEIQITQADIDGLAQKLDGLTPPLTSHEKALLSAMVTTVARKAGVHMEPPPPPTFHEQFATAFTPGRATDLVHAANIGRT